MLSTLLCIVKIFFRKKYGPFRIKKGPFFDDPQKWIVGKKIRVLIP